MSVSNYVFYIFIYSLYEAGSEEQDEEMINHIGKCCTKLKTTI
ncbi:hypothetical protein DB29_04259 [Shouchella clausii]|nr:hypothetical protein DB29_04259 [Shouchella clausii]